MILGLLSQILKKLGKYLFGTFWTFKGNLFRIDFFFIIMTFFHNHDFCSQIRFFHKIRIYEKKVMIIQKKSMIIKKVMIMNDYEKKSHL